MNINEKIESILDSYFADRKYYDFKGIKQELVALMQPEQDKPTIKTRPDVGEEYWYIDLDIRDVVDYTWRDTHLDNFVWNAGLAGFTEEEVQRKLDVMLAKQRIADYRKEHGMEWEFKYGEYNWCIAWDYSRNSPTYYGRYGYNIIKQDEIYFKTKALAEKCYDDCKKDWLTILGVDSE
jgi:hypothetical protein